MATFLVRAFEYQAGTALPQGQDYFFDDAGSVHATNIDKAAEAGIASGYAGGSYRPLTGVGRDQMASFLTQVLDKWRPRSSAGGAQAPRDARGRCIGRAAPAGSTWRMGCWRTAIR